MVDPAAAYQPTGPPPYYEPSVVGASPCPGTSAACQWPGYGRSQLTIKSWPISRAPGGKLEPDELEHLLTIELERPVRGELALIALRVMRELGVRHGAPFDVIDDQDHRFRLPEELQSIAAHILDQALGGTVVSLDPAQERLLRGRYIHQSAHWIPKGEC